MSSPATSPAEPGPSSAYTRYFLFMIVLMMLLNTVDRHIVSILVDDIKADLDLNDRQFGVILGPSFTVVYALCVLPLARWADVGVRRSIIALGLTVWSFFTVSTAAAQSFLQLLLLRAGVGIGEASASPAAQSLISDSVPPEQRSRGLSMLSIGAVLGLAAGMGAGGFINEIYGWRAAFIIAGVPGLLLALVFRLTVREPVRGAIEGREVTSERRSIWDDCRYLISLPSMRWLLVAHALALFYSTGKGAWEPTFIRRVYDMGSGAAGLWYLITTPLPGALGIFLGGWLCDRWKQRDARAHVWVPAVGSLASMPFLFAFLMWPSTDRLSLPLGLPDMPTAFLFSVFGSILGAMYTAPYLAAVQGLARLRMRASAAALFSLTGSGLGSGLGPLLAGDFAARLGPSYGEAESLRWALVALTSSLVLMVATSLMAGRRLREDLAANAAAESQE